MRRVLFFLLNGVLLGAGITDVRVVATTPTQAVLTYTAPDEGPCTLKVTAGMPGAPLVNDVNPDLFDGADSDGRPGNLVSGTARVFVIGKRAAERAKNGRMSSRALEAFTRHYYEIACGNDRVSGDFETTNVALGNTAPEPYPVDPDQPGEYAWPNMDFGAGPNEKHVDPQTGILINRLTGPKSYVHQGFPDLPNAGAINTGDGPNRWQTGGSSSLPASYIADDSPPSRLYVPLNPGKLSTACPPTYAKEIVQLDGVTVSVRGSSGASDEDAKLKACLTLDGVSCAAGTAELEVDLTACGGGCALGSKDAAWSPGGLLPFSGPDLGLRKTNASYDRASGTLTWIGGQYFDTGWSAGSRVWIDGQAYTVAAVNGPKSIQIATGLDLNSPTVTGMSFGVLLWKKTARAGSSVTVSDVKFALDASSAFRFWYQSATDHCHPTPVQHAGQDGYHCVLTPSSGYLLAWINRASGDANVLGQFAVAARSDPGGNGWGRQMIGMSGGPLFDGADPNVLYGIANDQNGKQVVLQMIYGGDNSPAGGNSVGIWTVPWKDVQNLTPARPDGYDLESLIQAFDPRYDSARNTCSPYMMDAGRMVITCMAGQDAAPGGWVVIFDPGIAAGPGSNPVVAAVPTHGAMMPYATPLRWCGLHSVSGGDPGWVSIGASRATGGTGFNTALAQAIEASDTTVFVTGEPGGGAVDVARVGDYFQIGSEVVRLTAKLSATQWTVERGEVKTTPAAHVAGEALAGYCSLTTEASSAWWNYLSDPHGHNASGKTVDADTPYFSGGHGAYKLGVFTRVTETGCSANAGGPTCLASRTGPLATSIHGAPTSYVNMYPAFAGIVAASYGFESHASRAQMAASDWEKQWVLDAHPILDAHLLSTVAERVSGTNQLYLLKKTPHPRQVSTYASCGSHPLLDVSGPASAIGDGAADAYKYCVPNAEGECRAGAVPGEVYVNCPNLTYLGCHGGQYDSNGQNTEDVCVFDGNLIFGAQVMQRGTAVTDRTGAYSRRITHGFARYRRQPEMYYANGKALPGGEWALFVGRWIDNRRSDIYAAKLPPFPQPDGVDRSTFVGVRVTVPPAPEGADNAAVEFGYDASLRCTSRQEICVAASASIDQTKPFYWAGETFNGIECTSGCTILVPAISQRVVYYRLRYRLVNGWWRPGGTTHVQVSP